MRTVSASRNDFIATVMPPCADREIGPVVIACLEVFVRGRSVWTQRRNERDFWLGLERRRRGVCPGGYASDALLHGEDVTSYRVGERKGAGRKFDDSKGS